MTHARWHILASVVFFYHDMSYILFIALFMILIILLSFSYNLVMLLLCRHWLYARAPSPFPYTLIGSFSDDLGFAYPDWMLSIIDQVFIKIVCFVRTQSFSLFDYGILDSPLFIMFPDSPYIIIRCHSISLLIYYNVWMLICDIAVIMIYYSLDL